LASNFSKLWQRPPTDGELNSLINDRVREEIATREAMALGLDKDDVVIRRRLRQKLEFVSEDTAAQVEPTEADLTAYLNAHPDSFRTEPRYTFDQFYFDPLKRGASLARGLAIGRTRWGGTPLVAVSIPAPMISSTLFTKPGIAESGHCVQHCPQPVHLLAMKSGTSRRTH